MNDLDYDLEWTAANDGNSEITEYIVYGKTAFPDSENELLAETTVTSATVSLKAYNTYSFCVNATNAVGTSECSEYFEAEITPAKAPIVNPEGVKGTGPDPGLMIVSWDVSVFHVVY